MIHCFDCKQGGIEREAQFIVFLDSPDQVWPVCTAHFEDYERSYGEENLRFWVVGETELAIQEVNKILRYMDAKYSYLLREYSELKKKQSVLEGKS
jgi:hypothetical protein